MIKQFRLWLIKASHPLLQGCRDGCQGPPRHCTRTVFVFVCWREVFSSPQTSNPVSTKTGGKALWTSDPRRLEGAMVRVKGDRWRKTLGGCLFASSVDWTHTHTHSLGSAWKNCSLICLLNYVIQRCFFFCFLHPDREFTAKTLLNGPNPLHDYRSPHHQGGFIFPPPPSVRHMIRTSYLMTELLSYGAATVATSGSCTATCSEAQGHTYHVEWRCGDKMPHFIHEHVGPEWPAVSLVSVLCSLGSRIQRKSPGTGHMTHCGDHGCITWLCSQSL